MPKSLKISQKEIAYIETKEPAIVYSEPSHVLDEVFVKGYPKDNFCTGENANILALADLRMTSARGAIVAEGEIYYLKELPKLTAKIRGENSGCAVINNLGMVVDVAFGISAGKGDSNVNIGYGITYPISAVENMIGEGNAQKFKFVDFPE